MFSLLNEDGSRWMSPTEQFRVFPACKELHRAPYHNDPRPVWLVLSIALRDMGYQFGNGIGISGHMDNMRKAVEKKHGIRIR